MSRSHMSYTVFLVALVGILLFAVHGQESSPNTPKLHFTPSSEVFLYDPIDEHSLDSEFSPSENDKYQGKWEISESQTMHVDDKKFLYIPQKARFYGLIRKFSTPLQNTGKDLVIQYEVKYNEPLSCAGSYIKVLDNEAVENMKDTSEFSDSTPYIIMFGPDKCGMNDKVHFILRHQNPVSHEWSEHHLQNPPQIQNDELTHVYTLILRQDNSFDIQIDGQSKRKGSLLEDMEPPINPDKMIDDPTDVKPDDWVDEEYIDDPEAIKPDDWDEDQPEEIPDPNDTMPEGWLEDEPTHIPDPEASAPEEWDEEEDGEWQAPLVPNPKCDIVGCGEWKPRFIKNPDYKGKWHPPKVKNPDYIGPWKPRQIENPHYFEDLNPYHLPAMGALSLDLWTVDDGIGFSSFLISFNEQDSKDYLEQVWQPRHEAEEALLPSKDPQKPITETISEFFIEKIADIPTRVLVACAILLILAPLVFCVTIVRSFSKAARQTAEKKKDDDANGDSEEELLQSEDDDMEGTDKTSKSSPSTKSTKKRRTKKVM